MPALTPPVALRTACLLEQERVGDLDRAALGTLDHVVDGQRRERRGAQLAADAAALRAADAVRERELAAMAAADVTLVVSAEEQAQLLSRAAALKAAPYDGQGLAGPRTVAVIFDKPTLRTQASFASGIAELGGFPMIVSVLVDGSSSDSASRSQEDCDGAGTVAARRVDVNVNVSVSIGGRSSGGGEWARGRGAYL